MEWNIEGSHKNSKRKQYTRTLIGIIIIDYTCTFCVGVCNFAQQLYNER